MRNNQAKIIALGGVLAALALVIMCIGGLIPVATYVCPVLVMVLLSFVVQLCGNTVAWAWYGAVMLLSLLLGPDKEAAVVFTFLGYYPVVKDRIDKMPCSLLIKLVLFNGMIMLAYGLLIYVFGMNQIVTEFQELGAVMTVITLLLGNISLFLLDRVLVALQRKVRRG